MTLQQQLESAVLHHQAGRLAEAEKIYRQVLAQQPNHADALNLLGTLAVQVGRLDAGVDLIRRAIAICPPKSVSAGLTTYVPEHSGILARSARAGIHKRWWRRKPEGVSPPCLENAA